MQPITDVHFCDEDALDSADCLIRSRLPNAIVRMTTSRLLMLEENGIIPLYHCGKPCTRAPFIKKFYNSQM